MEPDVRPLLDAGFKKQLTDEAWRKQAEELVKSGKSTGGPYAIDYVLKKGRVSVTIERNVGTQHQGDLTMQVTYPPVAIIQGPGGRVAADARNADLMLAMAEEVGRVG